MEKAEDMELLKNIRVVLMSPLYGGNVGSVCRAMANSGMSDLAIAAPRKLDMAEAQMMAVSAKDILNERMEYPTLADAVADCSMVVGTSARLGLYRSHSQSPREMAQAVLKTAASSKVALVFGPEDCGLTNTELALCTSIVQIPTSENYRSLNLAQAVMICCHEVYDASGTFEPSEEKSELATSEFRERMFAMWRDTLMTIGFMKDDKADHMMMGLRRILSRDNMSVDDVKIMMGIARQSEWAARELGTGNSELGTGEKEAEATTGE